MMKRKINKISMTVVTTVMFGAALLLSVERNEQGGWEFVAMTASAGDESGGGTHKGPSVTFNNPNYPQLFQCENCECYDYHSKQTNCLNYNDDPCSPGTNNYTLGPYRDYRCDN